MRRERPPRRRAAFAVLSALALFGSTGAMAQRPDAFRQSELTRLVLQDCGSCHGMRLTGGLGPPLTPQALADKPRGSMVAVILHGRHGTPMPPWAAMLSEAEAGWIVDRLREGNIDAR